MRLKTLGKTGLKVTENSFGALPIQRRSLEDTREILLYAYNSGINFFDTARMYTDSEYKIGESLSHVRKNIIIATKTLATTKDAVVADLEASLKNLKTDYIDIYQLHNPAVMPDPNDPNSSYAALIEAQKKGMIRYIGITNHRLHIAENALNSGLYDTLQFPLSYISSDSELAIIDKAKQADVGLIAMKGLSGGLLSNARACFAFFSGYDNVVPIWGIQYKEQLDEFLQASRDNVTMNAEFEAIVKKDRAELCGAFCRSCGYCMPCPVGINIPQCGRMDMLLSRAVWQGYMTDNWNSEMQKIKACIECGICKTKCPYQLDIPNLLKKQLDNYNDFYIKNKDKV